LRLVAVPGRRPADPPRVPATQYDVLIVGAGLAGTALALRLADDGYRVGLIAKKSAVESSSHWAQGGIAAALGAEDSPEQHAHDTRVAGAGLCHDDAVNLVAAGGPDSVEWLEKRGVPFTRTAGGDELHLTREGGHSQRRVAHVADATGEAVMDTLSAQARVHAGIDWLERLTAVDLVTTA
jgi:L-aspartate oxidase